MAELNEKQIKMCEESNTDFSDLKALFLNCTLGLLTTILLSVCGEI